MRKKSKYKPRPKINTIEFVLSGFKVTPPETQGVVNTIHHSAMHSLTHGSGTWKDWETVRNMLNTAVALSQTVFGNDYLDELKAAMVAHAKCGRRLLDGKGLGYTGEELQVINFAVDLAAEQLKLCTVNEIQQAQAVVLDCERNKKFYASVVQGRAITDEALPA